MDKDSVVFRHNLLVLHPYISSVVWQAAAPLSIQSMNSIAHSSIRRPLRGYMLMHWSVWSL